MYQLIYNSDYILSTETSRIIAPGGSGWAKYQRWLTAGNEPLPAIVPPQPKLDYRQKRALAYLDISPEGTFNASSGDIMDALIAAIYGDRSELDQIVQVINGIKAKYPKP